MNDNDPLQEVLTTLSLLVVGRQPTDTLTNVAELARDGIDPVDYVAITALRGGEPATTAATDPLVAIIDQAQYDVHAGPCLDAVRYGRTFRIDETVDDGLPWPEFRAAAAAAGVHSTLSLPLVAAGATIGALNLYSRRPGAFTDAIEADVDRFTEPVATLLVNAYMLWEARTLAENLEAALESKAVIEQAKGMLMAGQTIDAEEAFDVLRRASQRENVKLREIAQRLVEQAEERARVRRVHRDGRGDLDLRVRRGDGDGDGRGPDGDGRDGRRSLPPDGRRAQEEPLGPEPDPSPGPSTPPAGTTVT
jgi:GAF domain-containing protein